MWRYRYIGTGTRLPILFPPLLFAPALRLVLVPPSYSVVVSSINVPFDDAVLLKSGACPDTMVK
jgi:hypothetical protein